MSNNDFETVDKKVGIILNSLAKGGHVKKIWSQILDSNVLLTSFHLQIEEIIDISNIQTNLSNTLTLWITACINKGIKNFIAVGGDGTVHIAVNMLYKFRAYRPILGAIGLGSSNDFHKPFKHKIENIPVRLNFSEAIPHDLGEVTYSANFSDFKTEYLIINASIGFTAEANAIFNNKSKIICFLKKRFINLAIFFSIAKEIFKFKPICTNINYNNIIKNNFKIINIGITKNPHFAGDLKYESKINLDNGFFDIYILKSNSANKLSTFFNVIKILIDFMSENILKNPLITKSRSKKFEIKTPYNAVLEIDGELKNFKHAKFKILPKGLLLCP